MSDSTENTKDIDSYGVWVKRPPQDAAADELNTETDFPDFSGVDSFGTTEPDISEDPVVADDFNFDSLDDNEDTALSADELANISEDFALEETNSDPVIETESIDNSVESNPFEELNIEEQPEEQPQLEESFIEEETPAEAEITSSEPETFTEESSEAPAEDDLSNMFSDIPDFEETKPEIPEMTDAESPVEKEESSIPSSDFDPSAMEDGEISLDDFLDGGFSDPEAPAEEPAVSETAAEEVTEEAPAESEAAVFESEENAASDSSDFDPSSMEDGEISLDDFLDGGFTDPNPGAEAPAPAAEESSAESSSEIDISSQEDGEISLDDFLDGGFTDPNPGAEAPVSAPSASNAFASDEISLDDFLDEDFGSKQKEDDVSNDAPLDINVDFNQESEEIPVEDMPDESTSEENTASDDMFNSEIEGAAASDLSGNTEELSLDDFGIDNSCDDATAAAAGAAVNASVEGEEIDLSDFGIDSNADETPVEQDVQAAKKGIVVDYDLSITDEDQTASAPTVSEVSSSDSQSDGTEAEDSENEPASNVSNKLLEQIIADLSGLKSEINSLKGDLEDLKTREVPVSDANGFADTAADFSAGITENQVENAFMPEQEVVEESSGFFNNDDEDETIALSGDELNNIMNTADFSEVEENSAQEPAMEDESEPTPQADSIDADFSNDTPFESIEENGIVIPEEEHDSGLSLDIQNEQLEEPDLNDLDNSDPEAENEILIPGVDELANEEDTLSGILVESSNEDLMDSVKDSELEVSPVIEPEMDEAEPIMEAEEPEMFDAAAEAEIEPSLEIENQHEAAEENLSEYDPMAEIMKDEPSVEEQISDEYMNYLSEEKPALEEEDSDVPTVSGIFAEREAEAAASEEAPVEAETQEPAAEAEETSNFPADLKSDVKSVLLYMDQLLENLPEDKIVEFAKSEQFATYKKLFSELGLS